MPKRGFQFQHNVVKPTNLISGWATWLVMQMSTQLTTQTPRKKFWCVHWLVGQKTNLFKRQVTVKGFKSANLTTLTHSIMSDKSKDKSNRKQWSNNEVCVHQCPVDFELDLTVQTWWKWRLNALKWLLDTSKWWFNTSNLLQSGDSTLLSGDLKCWVTT